MHRETQDFLYPFSHCKRADLCGLTRMRIASTALLFNEYGKITNLSRSYTSKGHNLRFFKGLKFKV